MVAEGEALRVYGDASPAFSEAAEAVAGVGRCWERGEAIVVCGSGDVWVEAGERLVVRVG